MKEITKEERKELLMAMLEEVDSLCRKNNLTYYLAFGTLLGAIRHKGFIPWDDDVDIMMPRTDFEKLSTVFPTDGNYRFLTSKNTNNYPYAFGKIIDNRTVKNEPIRKKYQVIGLDIDVFPIDNYPGNPQDSIQWCAKIRNFQNIMHGFIADYGKRSNLFRTIASNIFIFFKHFLDDSGICTVEKLVTKICSYSEKYNNSETSYCGIASIAIYGEHKCNRKEVYQGFKEVEFEGKLFYAPIGYDEYLTDIYGDYMKLPPIDKRKTHHTNHVFWK